MGTYENFYLKQIKQLQEENKKLRAMLNEIESFEARKLRDEHESLHSESGLPAWASTKGLQPGRATTHFAGLFAQEANKDGRDLHPTEIAAIQRHAQNDAEYERRVAAARAARAANRPSI